MAVHAETAGGFDTVLVDHAQRAELHVLRIVIVGKRKTVKAVEPAVIDVAALSGFAQLDHCLLRIPMRSSTVDMRHMLGIGNVDG
jgi:hypothetical protein